MLCVMRCGWCRRWQGPVVGAEYTALTAAHSIPSCCMPVPTCRYGEGLVDIGSDDNGVVDTDEIVMSAM